VIALRTQWSWFQASTQSPISDDDRRGSRRFDEHVPVSEPSDYVQRNRAQWDEWAAEYVETGRVNWGRDEPTWGIWAIPESQVGLLPEDVAGLDAIELGCGTGYVSAWLARRGARPVGIDNSEAQLATARELQRSFSLEFPLLHGNAEEVPFPDQSFDLAISEYGASIWCDPYRWIPEAARLLRPGGRLIFLCNAPLLALCMPDEEDAPAVERLLRPYFGMHRFEWSDDNSVDFHVPHGEMIDVLRTAGFEVEQLLELRPPDGSTTRYPFVTLDWAQQWPCEEVWKARRVR
jgi:SAM-dependent methyltransferase